MNRKEFMGRFFGGMAGAGIAIKGGLLEKPEDEPLVEPEPEQTITSASSTDEFIADGWTDICTTGGTVRHYRKYDKHGRFIGYVEC